MDQTNPAAPLAFRPFTQADWYAFAGAESFKVGRGREAEPLIAEIEVEGEPGTIIVDANGASVFVGEGEESYCLPAPLTARAVAFLRSKTSRQQLRALSFTAG